MLVYNFDNNNNNTIRLMNKQLTQQNLNELFSKRKILQLQKQTLLNILSAKGIIYTYYKNKKLTQGNYDYQMERTSK